MKLPSVFPHLVLAVGFILVFTGPPFSLGGTTLILLMVYVTIYMPQGSVAADAAVSQIGSELPEASSVFGAGDGRTFRKIYLPLMFPGLIAGWAFLFARMVGDLTATALVGRAVEHRCRLPNSANLHQRVIRRSRVLGHRAHPRIQLRRDRCAGARSIPRTMAQRGQGADHARGRGMTRLPKRPKRAAKFQLERCARR